MGIPNKTHCLLGLNNIVKQNKQASGRPHHITQIDLIICRVGSGWVKIFSPSPTRHVVGSGWVWVASDKTRFFHV